jgi:hypothetical protein
VPDTGAEEGDTDRMCLWEATGCLEMCATFDPNSNAKDVSV